MIRDQLVLAIGGTAGFTSAVAAAGFFGAAISALAAGVGDAGFAAVAAVGLALPGAISVGAPAAGVVGAAVAFPCAIAGSDSAVSTAMVRRDTRVIGVVSAVSGAIA